MLWKPALSSRPVLDLSSLGSRYTLALSVTTKASGNAAQNRPNAAS